MDDQGNAALLTKAVDVIVSNERQRCPGRAEDFWSMFRDVLLALVIEKQDEILEINSTS